jgi:hypothetical protein
MAILVADGAQLTCDMGTTPSQLTVTPGPSHVASAPAPAVLLATVTDFAPGTNVLSFGMCNSPSNPAVQAATAAKEGAFTPAPCVPATAAPWDPPATVTVTISGTPAFDQQATCLCAWSGTITVTDPGQTLAAAAP